MNKQKLFAIISILLLLLLYGAFLAHKINLVTADLGRHIQNGLIFLQTWHPLETNFYSYTSGNYPVINHHWAAGVIFALIYQMSGIVGTQIFFIFLSLLAFGIFFWLAVRRANLGLAVLTAVPLIPLLAERTEIRPEVFSYLLSGIFVWLLLRFSEEKISLRALFSLLVVLEIAWVNLHIFFFLGPLIIGTFLLELVFQKPIFRSPQFKRLFVTFVFVAGATLINPFGWRAIAEPFTIMQNYGYRIVENQPVWFIARLIHNPNLQIYQAIFALLLLSFILILWRRRQKFSLSSLALATGFSIMAWLQIRNLTIFALFALPIISYNLYAVFDGHFAKHSRKYQKLGFFVLAILLVIVASGNLAKFFPYWRSFGFGLEKNNAQAAQFFRTNNLRGPIFNNYDIGSYLIFHLFPEEKVFADNRPEAYPPNFFDDIYIPIQENDEVWEQTQNQYRFNVIFFSYRDATPWGQNFLVKRVQDSAWAPIYVDDYVIIFLKRTEQNQSVIDRFEIPKSRFQIIRQA